ncbi:DUF3182 family protein [Acidovorax sp. LjRoot194]|uniref:DUF3182 family protein n=1 Tax=Acidovorax sp. LjRoot194 TaxID=3342280 RepID=UPI003ECE32BB
MTDPTVHDGPLRYVQQPTALQHEAEVVMPFTLGLQGHASEHERQTREHVARRVAHLKGCAYSDELAPSLWTQRTYLVPSETLVEAAALSLHMRGEDDLFGGVVPHAFVATKAITHPLIAPDAAAPLGWSHTLPEAIEKAVLAGYTAFTRHDAAEAGERLLALGPVRIKPVAETGGRGQSVVHAIGELTMSLAALSDNAFAEHGVVLEHNLSNVDTLSVGQVRVAGILASYHGRQRLTRDNRGAVAYGGSDLTVVRGDFHALLATLPPGPVRKAVDQALLYDASVRQCFPGFYASRVNYDVAQGIHAGGEWSSGVLEQSWRIGGATGAEIAALEAFHADPGLHTVRASCIEEFGPLAPPPASAVVYFQGEDPEVGPLTKYTVVHTDGDTA